ncbi:restriction endonuclease subunit S [Aeribacillus sp. FSL K6-8394]|uniref:restriction endonuclease subunit S n=1 Tax=Aeribacillus sp. FSL K6-8394 TaxID=2954570 RepID=UPI0030F53CEE
MSKKKQKSMEELLEEALVPEEEQPYKVPENWVWVWFKEVVQSISNGKKQIPQKYYKENGLLPVVDQGQQLISGYTDKFELRFSDELPVIIFGDHTKCIKWIDFDFVQGADGTKILKPLELIYPKYLYYLLQNVNLPDKGYSRHFKYLKETPLPIAPLSEQKRIAEKIERLFGKIDEAKRLIEEVKESFELRRAAILDRAFGGRLGTNDPKEKSMFETFNELTEKDLIPKEEQPYEVPKNWVWVKTGAIFEQIKEQVLPVGNETYVGLEHLIKGGGISHTELAKDIKSKKVVFKKGDVLYGKLRPYLNKHAVVDFDGVASTDILVLRTEHKYLNQLLDYYLGLPSTIDYAVSNSNGINLPRVSPKKMNDLPFPLPPKNEWKRIVKILDKMLYNLIEEQTLIEQLEAELISLKNSILYKAFRGELGTNDPTDEHAIELLKEVLKSK